MGCLDLGYSCVDRDARYQAALVLSSCYVMGYRTALYRPHTTSSPVSVSCLRQDVVKILLQRGADVNSKDKDNITALMEASIMDHRDVVKHLLKVKC